MKQRAGAIEREKKRKSGDRKQKGETRFSRQVVGEDGCRIEVLGILDSWEGGRDTWPRWVPACIRKTCTSTCLRINRRARYLQALDGARGRAAGFRGGLAPGQPLELG